LATRSGILKVRYEKLKVMYRISDFLNSTTDPDKLLRRILREAVSEMKASSGTIAFLDSAEAVLEIAVAYGIELRDARQMRLQVGQGVTGAVALCGKPLRVDDVTESSQYVELKPGVRSELAVPLKVEGEVIGVLNVDSTEPGAFSRDDERLLVAIANQASKVIHTARLYRRLTEQTRRLEALFDVGQALISPDPLPQILDRIARTVLGLMEIKLCSVMLLNDRRELVLSAVAGGSEHYTQRPNLAVSDSLIGEVVTQRQSLQVFDVKKAPRYRSAAMARKEHLASLLSVPIFFHESLIGILNIYTSRPRRFTEEEKRLLDAFASLCGIAMENARSYERVLRAEASIRQADRLATLGILSAEIAHEVRNPITIIAMLVHSLREDKAVAPGRERDVAIIAEKLERINRIVSQVLRFSKDRDTPTEPVDLNAVLEDVLLLVTHSIAARGIQLKRQYDAALPAIQGDRGHFEQVFLNLILNAVEAMPEGGALSIRTLVRTRDERGGTELDEQGGRNVVVVIRDTGVGIPPGVLSRLFSPFVSSRKEGIGLGLFISQKLLGQYGGKMEAKSVLDKGTVFTVEIPLESSIP
jgi:signal transduction histidine kinase